MADRDNDDPSTPVGVARRLSRRDLLRRLVDMAEDRPGKAAFGFDTLARDAALAIREQRYETALALYEQMIKGEPAHLEARRYRGWCLMKLERFSEARSVLEALLQAHPGDGNALLYIGISHAMEGQVAPALAAWRSYRDYSKVLILREINLIHFAAEEGEALEGPALARRIEDAIEQQQG